MSGKEFLITRAVTMSPTMPHGHRLNLIYKIKPFPRKAIDRLGWGKAHLFRWPINFISSASALKVLLPSSVSAGGGRALCPRQPAGSPAGGHTGVSGWVWLLLSCHLHGVRWSILKLVILLCWTKLNQEPSWGCGNAFPALQGNID